MTCALQSFGTVFGGEPLFRLRLTTLGDGGGLLSFTAHHCLVGGTGVGYLQHYLARSADLTADSSGLDPGCSDNQNYCRSITVESHDTARSLLNDSCWYCSCKVIQVLHGQNNLTDADLKHVKYIVRACKGEVLEPLAAGLRRDLLQREALAELLPEHADILEPGAAAADSAPDMGPEESFKERWDRLFGRSLAEMPPPFERIGARLYSFSCIEIPA